MNLVLPLRMEACILSLRGERVVLDADLAELYGVPTKRLNEQVKRNTSRFPADSLVLSCRQMHRPLSSNPPKPQTCYAA